VREIFTDLWSRLEDAEAEARQLDAAECLFEAVASSDAASWARRVARAFAVESVYSGIEGILKLVAAKVDGRVPEGPDWHRLLLDQMSRALPGVRPAVLGAATGQLLDELRRFRHVVRIHYGSSLDGAKVDQSAQTMRELLPLFRDDLARFEAELAGLGRA
jgi:hypothetical protein